MVHEESRWDQAEEGGRCGPTTPRRSLRAIRRLLGVKPKDTVVFAIKDGQVTIRPARFSLESAFGSLEPPRGVEDFDQLITEAKEDRATRAGEPFEEV
jgi:hypothetical protein